MSQSFTAKHSRSNGQPRAPRRRVLVTGAAGNIGSYFAQHSCKRYNLRLMVHESDDKQKVQGLCKFGEVVVSDVRRVEQMAKHFKGIDTVLHLAANPSPEADWDSVLNLNIAGTYNVFMAAKRAKCRRVIYASSIHAVSGYPADVQVKTSDPVNPGDLYGVSKCFGEALSRYMATHEGVSAIALRIGAFQPVEWARGKGGLNMLDAWVSQRDLNQLIERCIDDESLKFAIFNALSNNRFKRLDISDARELVGYNPQDDMTEENAALKRLHLTERVQTHNVSDQRKKEIAAMIHPDLILTNGNLITLNHAQPRARAMAVRDGRIVAVGDDAAILKLAGPETRRIDLAGKAVTPGFCDSHIHFLWFGLQQLRQADLVGSRDIDEVLARLSDLASRTSGWIQGHGFDQDKLRERRFPTREDLDRVSRDRPIVISRVCGHAVVVNSAALAQITESERRAGDSDTGLYTENDVTPYYRLIPPPTDEEQDRAALAACAIAMKTGITSVHTLLDTPDQMTTWSRLHQQGKLPLRVVGIPPYDSIDTLHRHGIRSGFGDDRLRFGACKLFSDGSLGAQTALLSSPYADNPGTCGIGIYDPDDLKQKCADAQSKGFQLAIHAIGDRAVRETIDAIEFALDGADNRVHRHRIEHASMCPPDCIERMAALKIVATLQPQFVTSDTWTPARVGPQRVPWCYPFKSMLQAGIPITLSSDCPVEKLDAFDAIAAAVGRHDWSPAETLTAEEAIRAYCLGSAYAADMEDHVGSLEVGKLADFVVLSDDPTRLDSEAIRRLCAERVYIGGICITPSPSGRGLG